MTSRRFAKSYYRDSGQEESAELSFADRGRYSYDPNIDSNRTYYGNEIGQEPSESDNQRLALFRQNKDLANICHNNGIPHQVYASKADKITSLEMFHYNFPIITALQYFPALTSLCIVAQDISVISGLEYCPLLQSLWICESKVSRIEGLDILTNLKNLYLYANQIKVIQGLEALTLLESLWLNDNEITILENLETLTSLKVLQLGNNKIERIGNALNSNTSLADLNLSGNRICSFREILHLTRLPNLTSLCLSDPNFSENPICSLCNYQTHVVYHLPNLHMLDTLQVTEESRRLIGATILKKRMYYHMRIRTIRRNTNFLLKTLNGISESDQEKLGKDVENLVQKSKKIQKWKDEILLVQQSSSNAPETMSKSKNDTEPLVRIDGALLHLNVLIDSKSKILSSLIAHRSELRNQIIAQSDMAVRKLLLELETGGNVRFEDEQKDESWVVDCENLVKLFIKRIVSKQSPRTIQIHRISRLHNRYMKVRFEQRKGKGSESDKPIHLCFHGADGSGDDVFAAVEYGSPLLPNQADKSFKGIRLSNYLDCHDGKERPEASGNSKKTLRQAIIFKTALRNTQQVDESLLAQVRPDDFPGKEAVFCASSLSSNARSSLEGPREYHVFDRDLLLPEFFIEYSLESDLDRYTTQLERLLVDITYSNRISHADMPNIVSDLASKLSDISEPLKVMQSNIPIAKLETDFPDITMGETMPVRSMGSLSALISVAGQRLTHLNLSRDLIMNPDTYSFQSQLTSLTLSGCSLKDFPALPYLPGLEKLDLSFNDLISVGDLIRLFTSLKELDLCGNQISELFHLENALALPQLSQLDVRFNPVAKRKGTRPFILSKTSHLRTLNGLVVDPSERLSLTFQSGDLLDAGASMQPQMFRPLSMRTHSGYGSSSTEKEYQIHTLRSVHTHINSDVITTLELDSCSLFDLRILPDIMPHLKWASFRNNYIKELLPLTRYQSLEELSLENNEIESIDILARLDNLVKLDASNNKVCHVESMGQFRSLMLLSLENNAIKSLRPFSKMPTLMELYVGNNLIVDLFSTFPLKDLPRLIILDLTGNAVCKLPNYRLFSVFHLNRLKILDGCGITTKEQNQAKEAYMGKLTIELLGEKIGHFSFKNISELDLRNCKIREIDCLVNGDFRNLRRLNFDNNQLVNLDCFVSLTGLKYLSLNQNRIERLLSTDFPAPPNPSGPSLSLRHEPILEYQKLKPLLPNLEELYLGHNQITRIADLGLYRMPQLRVLYLQGNKISKIDGLEQMTSLMELVLDKNQIKCADPLSFLSLINLKELHIKENRIRSLVHFDCLPNLQMLFLANNRLHELSEIEKMKLPSLVEISLASNAIARKQLYRIALVIRFSHLISIDGKDVTDEERQRAHAYYLEQCLLREDPVAKLVASSPHASQSSILPNVVSNSKPSIRITSVVLDGLEMKLTNSSSFGTGPQHFGSRS